MKAYKAFNNDWTCRGFQFEVGKTYTHEGNVSLCNSGFHACEAPLDILGYYPLTSSRFAEVDLDGVCPETEKDTKRAAASITLKAELSISALIEAHVFWVSKSAKAKAASSGDYSMAASSGYSSKAASSGDYSMAAATGERTCAMVAGINGAAQAGKNGAFALAWLDGDQIRISVGIVGENGIKPDTMYHCGKGGILEEVV